MTATLEDLPSTPLESPSSTEAGLHTHLDYWHRQLAANPALQSASSLASQSIEGAKLLRNPASNVSSRWVTGWDGGLGPFNHMQQGMGDLLLGSASILTANSQQGVAVPSVHYWENFEETTDEFLDATDRLDDMEGQRPTKYLIIAGQLVCKAAWAYDDLERREDLFGIAERMYRRVYEAERPWDDYTFKAGQYLADLQFHELSTRIRAARRAHEDTAPFREEAVRLLDRQGGDMLRHCDQKLSQSGDVFESFSSYIVRSEIYLDPAIKGNHPEIRTAFRSEDCPQEPAERTVDSKFDLVLGRFTSGGNVVVAEPWQLKLGRHAMDERERPYHPAIRVVVAEGISMGLMIDVVRGLRRKNTGEKCTAHVRQISRARELFEPLIARPKKAA